MMNEKNAGLEIEKPKSKIKIILILLLVFVVSFAVGVFIRGVIDGIVS